VKATYRKPLLFLISIAIAAIPLLVSAQSSNFRIPLIIDADTANEIDDLYALVYAIQEPRFEVLGITSAQFHKSPLASPNTVRESQSINEEIIKLMKRKNILLPLGSNVPLRNKEKGESSEASNFMIKMAHQRSVKDPLHIVILGSCTNVASAILTDPTIVSKIKVFYLGFWHDADTNVYNKKEFNSGNDSLAVEVLLNETLLDLTVMTATTSQHLVFTKMEVDAILKGKGGISDYLVERWENYERWWTKEDPEKKQWIMWDIAIVEALAHPDLAKQDFFVTPEENTQRKIKIYTQIEVQKMKHQFWKTLQEIN